VEEEVLVVVVCRRPKRRVGVAAMATIVAPAKPSWNSTGSVAGNNSESGERSSGIGRLEVEKSPSTRITPSI